ncbi:20S cyclosome subunit (BimA/Nuc2/Cdc27) [Pseudohyphozyma bogoriensis]|nr:20S cyclosome subunit (BimA/Nuc2/Cdc27) [Pseudohyphozyma bogoriensis]
MICIAIGSRPLPQRGHLAPEAALAYDASDNPAPAPARKWTSAKYFKPANEASLRPPRSLPSLPSTAPRSYLAAPVPLATAADAPTSAQPVPDLRRQLIRTVHSSDEGSCSVATRGIGVLHPVRHVNARGLEGVPGTKVLPGAGDLVRKGKARTKDIEMSVDDINSSFDTSFYPNQPPPPFSYVTTHTASVLPPAFSNAHASGSSLFTPPLASSTSTSTTGVAPGVKRARGQQPPVSTSTTTEDEPKAEKAFSQARQQSPHILESMELYSTLLWHLRLPTQLSFLAQDPRSSLLVLPPPPGSLPATSSLTLRTTRRHSTIRRDQRHYNARFGLGNVHLQTGKCSLAEYHFRKAVEINPTSATLVCCVGSVRLGERHQLKEALEMYERACVLAPESPAVRFKRVRILVALKRYDLAEMDLPALKDRAPNEFNVYFLLGNLYKALGRKPDMLKYFSLAQDIEPRTASLIRDTIQSASTERDVDACDTTGGL